MLRKIAIFLLAFAVLASAFGYTSKPAAAASCTQWYTVKAGDTLYKIANKFDTTWQYLAKIK